MIFSTNILNEDNGVVNKTSPKENINENTSLFLESLKLITEENYNITYSISSLKYFNEGIISNISDKLKEKLKELNPIEIIKKIINFFLDILEKIWRTFKAFIQTQLNSDTLIKLHKNKLKNLNSDIEYEKPICKYTNLRVDTAYTSLKTQLNNDFNEFIQKLEDFSYIKPNYTTIKLQKIQDQNKFDNDYFDEVRGKIVGKIDRVSKENFASELYNFFRNGGIKTVPYSLSPEFINNTLLNYEGYLNNIKSVEKDKDDMIKDSKKLLSDVDKIKLDKYIKETITQEQSNLFTNIIATYSKKVKATTDLYLQMFAAKLDAIKEERKQNSLILSAAIIYMTKEGL